MVVVVGLKPPDIHHVEASSEAGPRLAEHFDVLAVDLPGHGSSPMLPTRPTVESLGAAVAADLDAHGLDRVHVLGNSLGGRLALDLARRGRARSVVARSSAYIRSPSTLP